MKTDKRLILEVAGVVFVAVVLWSMNDRVTTLERHRDYMFEVVRERAVSKEWCEDLTDDRLLCTINASRVCRCRFFADEQDAEFKLLQEEIARRLDAEQAAAEELKAKAEAADGDLSGTDEPHEHEDD